MCCSRRRRRAPLEKVVRPLCPSNSFRIHDPDSCLFFLSGEGKKNGGMEGAVVNERGSDRYRRTEQGGKKKGGRVQTKWQRTDSVPVPVASEQLGLLSI